MLGSIGKHSVESVESVLEEKKKKATAFNLMKKNRNCRGFVLVCQSLSCRNFT